MAARILIADDESSILSFMKKALVDDGYEVTTVQCGKDACDISER